MGDAFCYENKSRSLHGKKAEADKHLVNMQCRHDIQYYTIPPPEALVPFVRFFWVMEGRNIRDADRPYIYRSMADGCAEMVFHYQGLWKEITGGYAEDSAASGINGPSQYFRRFTTGEDFGIFGAYLYPFALQALLGIPAGELKNEILDTNLLSSCRNQKLEDRMMLAQSNQERFHILSEFFLQKLNTCLRPDDNFHSSVREIIQKKGAVDLKKLADDHAISLRQFQRKFKLLTGFSPKLYSRIIRFGAAMNAYHKSYHSLTEIAYDYGYYDQSHFIHEFKAFSGYHPGQYFSGRTEGIEWRES